MKSPWYGLSSPMDDIFYWSLPVPLPKALDKIHDLIKRRVSMLLLLILWAYQRAAIPNRQSISFLFAALKSLGTTVIALDHQAKLQDKQSYDKKTPFGSAYKFNLSRCVFQIKMVKSKESNLYLMLTPKKNNFKHTDNLIPLRLIFENKSVRVEKAELSAEYLESLTNSQIVLDALDSQGPMTASEACKSTGINRGSMTNILVALKKDGKVVEDGKKGNAPIYKLPPNDAAEKEAA